MYGWIWRKLPGATPVKLLLALVIVAVVCVLLFTIVFPWVSSILPVDRVTV